MTRPKALILAGGRGMRLYPITKDIPKPLVPVANKAVILHILSRLYKEGITEAVVALGHDSGKVVKYLEKNGTEGVTVSYYTETEPLGTAGGAASAKDALDGDFFCIGGDLLFDFDLMPALAFHRKAGALATLIVARSGDPCRYGSLYFDGRGRITSFCEKPAWKDVRTDIISTGIYVLSPRIFDFIRTDRPCDFANDVFPKILGGALYAYEASGYYCDIGTPGSFLCANTDAARGVISGIGGSPVSPEAVISPLSEIKDSVVFDDAFIGEGAYVENSIVCRGAIVAKNAVLRRAVVAPETTVRAGERPPEDESIVMALSARGASAAAREISLMASGEQASEIAPVEYETTYTVSGRAYAPFGAARTVGEMLRRGASVSDRGVVLKFDRGAATISCADASTVDIIAESDSKDGAADVFEFAKNGVKNLF